MEKIILIGGGAHCSSIIDSIYQQALFEPVGILDTPDKVGHNVLGVKVIGVDEEMGDYFEKGIKYAFLSLGSIGDTFLRRKLKEKAEKIGFQFPVIIDSTAIISKATKIGNGTFIGKGAIVNANASIGEHAIINSGTIVEHDCTIGNFVHLAPGTTMSGSVSIGSDSHIGTNATIIQEVIIGNSSLIGAGSVVLKDIGSFKKAYGNPCKEVES